MAGKERQGIGYTDDEKRAIVERYCDFIAEMGIKGSTRRFCEMPGNPDRKTLAGWLLNMPDVAGQVRVAKFLRAETIMDDDLYNNVYEEGLDAKVMAQRSWYLHQRAKSLDPVVFGDRKAITDGEGRPLAPGTVSVKIDLSQLTDEEIKAQLDK